MRVSSVFRFGVFVVLCVFGFSRRFDLFLMMRWTMRFVVRSFLLSI